MTRPHARLLWLAGAAMAVMAFAAPRAQAFTVEDFNGNSSGGGGRANLSTPETNPSRAGDPLKNSQFDTENNNSNNSGVQFGVHRLDGTSTNFGLSRNYDAAKDRMFDPNRP